MRAAAPATGCSSCCLPAASTIERPQDLMRCQIQCWPGSANYFRLVHDWPIASPPLSLGGARDWCYSCLCVHHTTLANLSLLLKADVHTVACHRCGVDARGTCASWSHSCPQTAMQLACRACHARLRLQCACLRPCTSVRYCTR